MNSILIPTDYQSDTFRAMELTRWVSGNAPVHIILLSISPLPDSITDYLHKSPNSDAYINGRVRLMEEWENLLSQADHNVTLTEHHQYGASPSIIEQVMERFNVNRIVVPYSFQKSEQLIHQEALNSLRKSNCKITFLPGESSWESDLQQLKINGELVEMH